MPLSGKLRVALTIALLSFATGNNAEEGTPVESIICAFRLLLVTVAIRSSTSSSAFAIIGWLVAGMLRNRLCVYDT